MSLAVMSLAALVAGAVAIPDQSQDNPYWSGPIAWDIDGTGSDGGTSQGSLQLCQAHCQATAKCQSAQYSMSATYAGNNNCFIYDSQGPFIAIAQSIASFRLWKLMPGSWSGPIALDIGGKGFAQSHSNTLDGCKEKCLTTKACQAVQWSGTDRFEANNCFLFNTQAINSKQFMSFNIYKFNHKGCSGSANGCCPDNVENKPTSWGGCNCGSAWGCCADGVTPQVAGVTCPVSARRLVQV